VFPWLVGGLPPRWLRPWMYVATVVFRCFKSRSGVASLLLPPFAASSLSELVGHPYYAVAGSFRIGGATRPSPLLARAAWGLHATRNRCGAARAAEGARRGGLQRERARMLALFLYAGERPDMSWRRTCGR
jgi:hypothetical protein